MDAAAIEDLFAPLFPVRVKRMFGGLGVYRGEAMFALEAYGELYLKTDSETRPDFIAAESRPFAYAKKSGEQTIMSYWLLPTAAYDDESELQRFTELALAAAERSLSQRKSPRRSTRARGPVTPT